ncbi:GntR family transcriptional regulator [Thauera sinica]|uniref:GntR family transcriptional regulator n=1 Tax=Thauera sinica TaxID=2665146 RepID=A0ABW1AW40_9RHOO|nr:GntR family transcriptional regulator [Thauera sp. K11]
MLISALAISARGADDMETPHKKALIYQEILQRLLAGRYRFGERIPVKEIGEETGVSRQPVMTALYSLQERGFVRITAQVGCEVISPAPDEVEDFYRMFAAVEGVIAGLAAGRATADELARLRDINAQLDHLAPHAASAADYRRINVDFHRQLHLMAHSPLISARQLANFEMSDFFIVQSCGFDAHLDRVAGEHQDVIDAIASGDARRADAAAQAHILSVSATVVGYLRRLAG